MLIQLKQLVNEMPYGDNMREVISNEMSHGHMREIMTSLSSFQKITSTVHSYSGPCEYELQVM